MIRSRPNLYKGKALQASPRRKRKTLQASPRRRRKQPNSQHWESALDLSQEEKEATKLPALGKYSRPLPGGEGKRFRPLPGRKGSNLTPSTGKVLRASPKRRRKQPNSQHWESTSGLSQEEKEATLPQHWESALPGGEGNNLERSKKSY